MIKYLKSKKWIRKIYNHLYLTSCHC